MNKDILLGILIGFILTVILAGVGGFVLYTKISSSSGNDGSPSSQQQAPQGNGTLFGCAALKLVGTETVKAGVPFTIQNSDAQPHTVFISGTQYDFAAEEKKSITIGGWGVYHPQCDGHVPANSGELNVEK